MEKKVIHLVPVGEVNKVTLEYLSGQIENVFTFSVRVAKSLPHPDYAWNKTRKQYKADLILQRLQELEMRMGKILGVVDLDCYTPRLNFVLGQALMGGRVCLIALPRLKQGFYGLPEDEKLFYTRATKEAIHELLNLG